MTGGGRFQDRGSQQLHVRRSSSRSRLVESISDLYLLRATSQNSTACSSVDLCNLVLSSIATGVVNLPRSKNAIG
jgi:hypothetical protein